MDTPTERVRPLDVEVERVIAAARDSLTDEMVTRLAATAGDAVDLIDQVNRAGLGRALPALTKLVASGVLREPIARPYVPPVPRAFPQSDNLSYVPDPR